MKYKNKAQKWWCTPVNHSTRRVRQENCEFKAGLSYIVRPYPKEKGKRKKMKIKSSPYSNDN
jgi:hypothetical protein